jgi:hypothetical protein
MNASGFFSHGRRSSSSCSVPAICPFSAIQSICCSGGNGAGAIDSSSDFNSRNILARCAALAVTPPPPSRRSLM